MLCYAKKYFDLKSLRVDSRYTDYRHRSYYMLIILGHSGEWRCGMREGFGVMVYSKDQSYEGEWVRNKRHGWGRMSYSDGSYYEVIQLPYNYNGAQSLIKHSHTCFIPG